MAYALVEELRQLLDIPPEDTANDVDLQRALDAASLWVDWFTGRTFALDTTPVAKVYPAATESVVTFADLQSAAPTVEVDTAYDGTFATTLTAAQFSLEPHQGPPYDLLRTWADPAGDDEAVCFDVGQLVRITGLWGYADARGRVPANVSQATLLLAARWYKRREVPFNVLQQPELDAFQTLPPHDTDVHSLLFPLSRPGSPGATLAGAQAAGAGVWGAAWVAV
jgi:hypothetical protein